MPSVQDVLTVRPAALAFGTSGLRGLVGDMTDLECYINTTGFLRFLAQADNLPAKSTVYLAGDLRFSTPRILQAVHKAITDAGHTTVYCGLIPTPALALYAWQHSAPCIMVTGSHIPDDRNGIKFNKTHGEVLKEDELAIKEAVAATRATLYAADAATSVFGADGQLTAPPKLPAIDMAASQHYLRRYTNVFGTRALAGKKIVFYQHSSVGRDVLVELLEHLGATVVPVGRSDKFIPIDTENVTPDDQAYFTVLARDHPDAFAIVSTDGDADRPFVIDEHGTFHRGDILGAVVADWLQADFAAMPVSASDAVDNHLTAKRVGWQHTKIGSPYVVVAMMEALQSGYKHVTGWEVNGGFLTGSDIVLGGKTLQALPTRDAMLPILGALLTAIASKKPVSAIFAGLPQRFTQAGLINNFPTEVSLRIIQQFSADTPQVHQLLGGYFTPKLGFGKITSINSLDGVRVYFDNGDIAHLRPSGNAPQLRIYSVANRQDRADEIVRQAIAEPDGIFRTLQQAVVG